MMYYTINYPNINRVFYVNIINLLVNVSLIFLLKGKFHLIIVWTQIINTAYRRLGKFQWSFITWIICVSAIIKYNYYDVCYLYPHIRYKCKILQNKIFERVQSQLMVLVITCSPVLALKYREDVILGFLPFCIVMS